MPIEYTMLKDKPEPLSVCPKCKASPFESFLRGLVQRSPYSWRTLWLPIGPQRPYCTIICSSCKEIVGHE